MTLREKVRSNDEMPKRKTSEKVAKRRDRVVELVMIDGYDDPATIADLK